MSRRPTSSSFSDAPAPRRWTQVDRDLDLCMSSLHQLAYSLKSASDRETKTNRDAGNPDEFTDLKSQVIARLSTVRALMDGQAAHAAGPSAIYSSSSKKKHGASSKDPKSNVEHHAAIRDNMRKLLAEFRNLEGIYAAEASRKRSKYSKEEAEGRRVLIEQLAGEIEAIKNRQRDGWIEESRGGAESLVGRRTKALEDSEIFGDNADREQMMGTPSWAGTVYKSDFMDDVTAGQREKLLTIKQRDEAFDDTLQQIAVGVDDLRNLAFRQNEEVKMQNLMLEDMSNRMDKVAEKIEYVNSRMKDTLKKVGRGLDKVFIDIFCIILSLGLAAALVHLYRTKD